MKGIKKVEKPAERILNDSLLDSETKIIEKEEGRSERILKDSNWISKKEAREDPEGFLIKLSIKDC